MPKLSPESLAELKVIARTGYGDAISDSEIEEIGMRLLRLFSLLTTPTHEIGRSEAQTKVTEPEFKAIKYLHYAIYHGKKSPSVRDITAAVGFTSSRSGFRLLSILLRRGFVYRDREERLQLAEHVRGCKPKLTLVAANDK